SFNSRTRQEPVAAQGAINLQTLQSPASKQQTTGRGTVGKYVLMLPFLALVLWILLAFDVAGWVAILQVVIGLGLVVFIHEFGHFVVAKLCDVHVQAFSIGFGPALAGCRFRWGETTYLIGCFPLGGYVKMVGEGATTKEGETDPRSFKNKPVYQRMAI